MGVLYRHRGISPQPEQYAASLWADVLNQFLVVDVRDQKPLGLVVCYGINFRHQHAYIGAAIRPDMWRLGWPMEGLGLFISYLFPVYPFRKLSADSLTFNLEHFASGARFEFHEEARLVDHEFHDGRWYDKVTLAVYREQWERRRADGAPSALLSALRGEDAAGSADGHDAGVAVGSAEEGLS